MSVSIYRQENLEARQKFLLHLRGQAHLLETSPFTLSGKFLNAFSDKAMRFVRRME